MDEERQDSMPPRPVGRSEGPEDFLSDPHCFRQTFDRVARAKLEWERTVDCVDEMVLLVGSDGRIRRCNRAVRSLSGRTFQEILGQDWRAFLAEQGILLGEHGEEDGEVFRPATGQWFLLRHFPLEERSGGAADGRVITLTDHTDIKVLLTALQKTNREVEARRASIHASLSEIENILQEVAEKGDFSYRSPLGSLTPCFVQKGCERTTCPCYGKEFVECWNVAGSFSDAEEKCPYLASGGACSDCPVYVDEPVHQIVLKFNRMMEILDAKNRELVLAYSKLKASQSQILQQEKMASIGQLAAGVAHEINNPMGFISSNINTLDKYLGRLREFIAASDEAVSGSMTASDRSALRKKLKVDAVLEDIPSLIRETLDGADRVRTIVQNLKSFSHVDEAALKEADINACIESTLNIVHNELKYKATVVKDLGDLPRLKCYPQQLNQVFMNLLVNAGHALKEQGQITVRSRFDDGNIQVSIADTGIGIPPENLGRIFEPFFTTKEVGKGTGLGLSIVYDIVQRHKGHIRVESELERGTCFTVILPLQGAVAEEAEAS